MRVLHVSPSFYPAHVYGGPVQSVYELCRSLPRYGCEVRILTTNANGSEVLDVETGRESEIAPGVRIVYCRRTGRDSVSPELLRLLPSRVCWADIVHLTAVYSFPTFPTMLACRIFGKPLVWSPRGSLQRGPGSRHRELKSVWDRACGTAAPEVLVLHSTSEEERQANLQRFPRRRGVVVPNGVEIPSPAEHIPGNGEFRLLYLGRIHPQKGIERLIEALSQLNRGMEVPRWSLTVAGPGEPNYVSFLQCRIADLGVGKQVRFTGQVAGEEKRNLFLRSDLLVLPSHAESFGQVVVEALAHGVPVVASTGTPWKDLLERGCGFWVENDPESLARVIERMSRMPLRAMGARGRHWMVSEFSWDQRALTMSRIYSDLIGSHKHRGGRRNENRYRMLVRRAPY